MQTKQNPRPAATDAGAQVSSNGDGSRSESSRQKRSDQEFAFDHAGDLPPYLPEGEDYHAAFLRVERARLFGDHKLYLYFEIIHPSEAKGNVLWLPCNAPPKGQACTPAYKFWRIWVLAAGHRPARRDRLSTNVLRNKYFRVRVRTVRTVKTTSGKQIPRDPLLLYSVISDIVEVIAG